MKNACRMAKSSLKLLFRNKSFFAVGILIPILATFLINLQNGVPETAVPDSVCELPRLNTQMAYLCNFNCLPVKVYDRTNSDQSQALCAKLTEAGLFQIFRVDCSAYSTEEIMESARASALDDKVGAILILEENPEDTKLFRVGEDERFDLLKEALGLCIPMPSLAQEASSRVTYVTVNSGDDVNYNRTKGFAYCVAVATIAFIFGGVLILGTILTEKQDHVYSRLMLTTATRASYILSKVILTFGISLIQTLVMTLSFVFLVKADLEISVLPFACILFLEGIIFNFLSVCTGMFCNSMSAAAFLAFTIWSISALLAGTYFDISSAGDLYKKIAMLMPQRWALLAATQFQNGNSGAYPLIFGVTAAYLLVILVIGILGLKLNERE